MGSSQRSSSNEAPQTNALIFLVTATHFPIQKSRQTSSSNKQDSRYAFEKYEYPFYAFSLTPYLTYLYRRTRIYFEANWSQINHLTPVTPPRRGATLPFPVHACFRRVK
jgi:hypothetical protein